VETGALEIVERPLASPDARAVIEAAEAELDRRYGTGADAAPLEALLFEPPLGSFLVALLDGSPVGGVGLRWIADRTGEVKRLWVHEKLRRSGLATALMMAIEERGQELGMGLIELETGPRQPEAVAFYASRGWELVDDLPVRVSDYPGALRFLKYYDDAMRS
jgi:GNAT superfamily N-acetyltransferase